MLKRQKIIVAVPQLASRYDVKGSALCNSAGLWCSWWAGLSCLWWPGDGMEHIDAHLVLSQCEAETVLLCSHRCTLTPVIAVCTYMASFALPNLKHLVSQGGKNRGGRVRGQEQYCCCLTWNTLCRSLHWKPPLTRLPTLSVKIGWLF